MNNIRGLDEIRFIIERGYIYWATIPEIGGNVQKGVRPVLIIQNDKGNDKSPNVTVVPITSKGKKWMPTHVDLTKDYIVGLPKDSIALCESPMTLPKKALGDYIGAVELDTLDMIDDALKIQLSLGDTSRITKIKEFAVEIVNNINHYEKTIEELGQYLPKEILKQTEIRLRLEISKLEQYCTGRRLNINDFYIVKTDNKLQYMSTDKKVISL